VASAPTINTGWYPVLFGEFSDHNDRRRLLLPNHRPEVVDGVRHWSLSCYVDVRFATIALNNTTSLSSLSNGSIVDDLE